MPPPMKRLRYTSASFSEAPTINPADNRPENRIEASQDEHRQGLQGNERQAKLHPQACAPEHASHQRHHASGRPGDAPDVMQRNAHRQGRLMVVRERRAGPAQCASGERTD